MTEGVTIYGSQLLLSYQYLIKACKIPKDTIRSWHKRNKISIDLCGNSFIPWAKIPAITKRKLIDQGYNEHYLNTLLKDQINEQKQEKSNQENCLLVSQIEDLSSKFRINLMEPVKQFNPLLNYSQIIKTANKTAALKAIILLYEKGYNNRKLKEAYSTLHNIDPIHFPKIGKFNININKARKVKIDKGFIKIAMDGKMITSPINAMIIGRPSDVEDENIFIPKTHINLAEFHARKLVYLCMNPGQPNKLDYEQIHLRYEIHCNTEGVAPCDISTVKKFLSKDDVKLYTTRERQGMKAFDKFLPHTKGKKPTYSLSKGGYDGFQVDFYTRHNKKQVMLTVVAVFDYMSGAITGYDVGLVEDGLMVRNMYRNHLNQNNGYSYIEIESDRFSGNLMADTRKIFESCCQHITQPAPNDPVYNKAPNPKARYVERLVQEFNRMTQAYPGWKGTNFYTRDASRRPNQDYMEKTAIETLEEGIKQIIDLVEVYNNQKLKRLNGKSRMELFRENMNPSAPQIPSWSRALILNQNTIVAIRHGVVEITVNRRRFEYDFHDFEQYAALTMKGLKVAVYYDETDMDTVDIFGENDQYIATLTSLKRFNKAKAEQTPGDLKEFGKQIGRRNNSRNNIDRKSLEILAAEHNIDIGALPIKEARERVYGAIAQAGDEVMIPGPELHKEVLESEEVHQSSSYYEDRLLTACDMRIPEPGEKGMTKREAYLRKKYGFEDDQRESLENKYLKSGTIFKRK